MHPRFADVRLSPPMWAMRAADCVRGRIFDHGLTQVLLHQYLHLPSLLPPLFSKTLTQGADNNAGWMSCQIFVN